MGTATTQCFQLAAMWGCLPLAGDEFLAGPPPTQCFPLVSSGSVKGREKQFWREGSVNVWVFWRRPCSNSGLCIDSACRSICCSERHKYDLPSQAPHVGPHNECVNVKYKVFPIPISHLFLSFQKMRAYPSYLVAWKLRVGVYIYTDFSCQLGATPLKIYAIYVDPFRPACPVRPSLKASHVTKPLTMCSG